MAAEDSKGRWNEIQTDGNYKSLLTAFRESEIKKGLGGKRMSVDITAVPSKFAWRTSRRKRPSARFSPKKSKRRLEESFTEESFTVSSDITSEADDTVSLETAEIVNTGSQDSCESLSYDFSCYNCAVR